MNKDKEKVKSSSIEEGKEFDDEEDEDEEALAFILEGVTLLSGYYPIILCLD